MTISAGVVAGASRRYRARDRDRLRRCVGHGPTFVSAPSSSSPGMSRAERLALEVAIMMSERQDIGRGVEEIIALRDADRLQRRADRAGAAEQQRGDDAAQRAPARENHQRHRHQALAGRQALVPRAGIGQRKERAADAGEKAADGGRRGSARDRPKCPSPAPPRRCRRRCARSGPSGCCAKRPGHQDRDRDADEEQRIDVERALAG